MFGRILALTIVVVELSWGQQNNRADSLVAEVASFARTGTSWRAEGSIVTKGADGKEQPPEEFRIAYQLAPSIRARLEIVGGPNPLLRICDGASQWIYYRTTNNYVRVMLPKIGPCADPINAWPLLSETMQSPVFAGNDSVITGDTRRCRIVRGTNAGPPQSPVRRPIDLCVDPTSKLIFRFQTEESSPTRRVKTFMFSSLERNVRLDPDLFKFHPPEGSSEIAIINWLDPGAPPTDSAYRISDQMGMPELVSIVPPTPKFPAAVLPPNSAVVLAVEVNPNGMVQNIKVNYSLGKDIDNNAIEAVKKWRFEPATQDGKPITVVTAIAILFSASSP